MKEDPWKVHGYFFSVCFAIFMISLGRLSIFLMNVPSGVPLRDVLTPVQGALFIAVLGVCAAVAYLLARWASLGLALLIKALRRN